MRQLLFCTAFILSIPTAVMGQTIQDLDWMSGYWTGTSQGVAMEELWTPAAGNIMLGLHRDVMGGKSAFEFLRVAVKEDGTMVYVAAPSGKEPTEFKLTELRPGRAVFENLSHDFPQRIIYSLSGNRLTARIENESGEKGMQWTWTKSSLN